jgi:hypothetical protein
MSERNEILSEVGRRLQAMAVELFDRIGPHNSRGAALWDAACYVVEQLGDGDWRGPNEFLPADRGDAAVAFSSKARA